MKDQNKQASRLDEARSRRGLRLVVMLIIAALAALGFWLDRDSDQCVFKSVPGGIMGTETTLVVIADADNRSLAVHALEMGEQRLRKVESMMSRYLEDSEISNLNAASDGEWMPLAAETLELLQTARRLAVRTDGAMDVTYHPAFELWRRCAKQRRLPRRDELRSAKDACGWGNWRLLEDGAKKSQPQAGIDLGGIAKGYAIDRAVVAMKEAGARAGMVNVGGDLRCFGAGPEDGKWPVRIRDPFRPSGDKYLLTIAVRDAAVCTSGNYYRYHEIDDRRYSHIIDPRTLRPADAIPSVTVVARDATTADAWSTALSVLGKDGLGMLKPADKIEAMLVVGGPDDYKIVCTEGMKNIIAPSTRRADTAEIEVWKTRQDRPTTAAAGKNQKS